MKRLRRLSLLFVIALIATGCLRRDYIALGEQAMAAEDYHTAEIYFRKAIQKAPRSDRAFYDLGTAYLKEQDYNFAYQSFTHAAELNPRNTGATVEVAKILLLANQPGKAEEQARLALAYEPQLLPASLLLGEALAAQDKTDAARVTLEQAVSGQPKSSDAYLALAALESKINNTDKAMADLDKAIANDPHNPEAYIAKANFLRNQGQLKPAIVVLRKGLETNRSSDVIKFSLADALLADGETSEGMGLLRSIKKTRPVGVQAQARLALAEVENNQLDAAAADVDQLLDRGARSVPEVMYARARLLLAQGKTADAQKTLKDLIDVAPKFAPAFYFLGVTYAQAGDFTEATDQLQAAAKLAPTAPETYVMLGNIDLRQGYYPAAVGEAEQALHYAPDNVPALMLKGDALYGAGRDREATELFQRLTTLAPQNSVVHERLGQLAAKRNDLNTAATELEAALRLDPSNVQILNNLAVAIWQTQGAQAALDRVRTQISLRPNNADSHALLAALLIKNHQPELAVQDLKKAVEKFPDSPALYFILAQAYATTGKTANAEAELKASLVKHPKYTPALMILGSMADQAGRYDEAISYYQRLLAIAPNFGLAANNLAFDYMRENKNLDQALELAQHARQLMPHDPHVADTLGEVFLKRGLPDNAVPLFRESIQANNNSASAHYHLGFALLALNQRDEARKELATALKLAPTAQDAVEARQQLARLNGTERSSATP